MELRFGVAMEGQFSRSKPRFATLSSVLGDRLSIGPPCWLDFIYPNAVGVFQD